MNNDIVIDVNSIKPDEIYNFFDNNGLIITGVVKSYNQTDICVNVIGLTGTDMNSNIIKIFNDNYNMQDKPTLYIQTTSLIKFTPLETTPLET